MWSYSRLLYIIELYIKQESCIDLKKKKLNKEEE